MEKIIIVGIGETADIAHEYISNESCFKIVAFSVSQQFLCDDVYKGLPLVSLENLPDHYPPNEFKVFVAMSGNRLNRSRKQVYLSVKKLGYQCITYISPHAFVSKSAKIGENCFIFENNVIQSNVEIGNNVILWSGNHIGHRSKIGENVFISSHCVVSGFCEIGDNSFLGVNCTFSDNIKIGKDCFVGMGAVVGRNLPENTLIKPAKSVVADYTAKQLCEVEE